MHCVLEQISVEEIVNFLLFLTNIYIYSWKGRHQRDGRGAIALCQEVLAPCQEK